MCSIHTSALLLLVYISGHASGIALVRMDFEVDSRVDSDQFYACLSDSPSTRKCPDKEGTEKFSRQQLNDERAEGRQLRRGITIDWLWKTQKYLVISPSLSGSFFGKNGESIDVSHLTLKNGTLETTVLNGLRVTITLMCADKHYGADCNRGCEETRGTRSCSEEGERICRDHWTGPDCSDCRAPWTGGYCNESTAVASSPSVETAEVSTVSTVVTESRLSVDEAEVVDQVKLTSDCKEAGSCRTSKDDITLVICISVILVLFAIVLLFVLLAGVLHRRKKTPCPTSASLQSSHFLLTIDDDSFTEKLME